MHPVARHPNAESKPQQRPTSNPVPDWNWLSGSVTASQSGATNAPRSQSATASAAGAKPAYQTLTITDAEEWAS